MIKNPIRKCFLEIKATAAENASQDKINAIIAKLSAANKIWTLLDVFRKDRSGFKIWKNCLDKESAAKVMSRWLDAKVKMSQTSFFTQVKVIASEERSVRMDERLLSEKVDSDQRKIGRQNELIFEYERRFKE